MLLNLFERLSLANTIKIYLPFTYRYLIEPFQLSKNNNHIFNSYVIINFNNRGNIQIICNVLKNNKGLYSKEI